MVDFLQQRKIDLLFCVGGDGTQRGAHALYEELERRGRKIAIVGIPKTIDNDIQLCDQTFGFATAIEIARQVLDCAHVESKGVKNGIGLVKLMGRDSGFIAVGATLASQEVNFTLIPEHKFALHGERGFLNALEERIVKRKHAVIALAEGAGQHLFPAETIQRDASGNVKFQDIGPFLKQQILDHFARRSIPVDVKYIDPSYYVRSVPANCSDSLLCDQLARRAVHAGLAGKTDVLVAVLHHAFIHVPIPMATAERRQVNLESEAWSSVLAATGQPRTFE
jgi:6-phosphofructokinase 1